MEKEPHGYVRWKRYADELLASNPTPNAEDLVALQERATSQLVFDIEKDLCVILGRQWNARGGQSVDGLLDEIRKRFNSTT